MPHDIFIDQRDNVWVTDVALHQVALSAGFTIRKFQIYSETASSFDCAQYILLFRCSNFHLKVELCLKFN